jgi:hypothetical protein
LSKAFLNGSVLVRLIITVVAAWAGSVSLVASVAWGQTNNFIFDLRIRTDALGTGSYNLSPAGVSLPFWLEARCMAVTLAPGHANYGVMRASTGPAGQLPSFISVTDSVASTRLARGVVSPNGPGGFPLTGRAPLYRSGGPVNDSTASDWHSTTLNGPGGAAFGSGTGNQFGAFDLNGDRLHGFDAAASPLRFGATDPWASDFPATPIGEWSPWARLYNFDVLIPQTVGERSITLRAWAFMSAGVLKREVSDGMWLMTVTNANSGSRSVTATEVSFHVPRPWPTPSAATMMALGLCVAGRRRR